MTNLKWSLQIGSRLIVVCIVTIQSSVGIPIYNCTERNLFVISTYASKEGRADQQTREFYDELATTLVRRLKCFDTVVATGDFNAHVGKLSAWQACSSGRCASPAQYTDNRDRLSKCYVDNHLFQSSSNFRHNSGHT